MSEGANPLRTTHGLQHRQPASFLKFQPAPLRHAACKTYETRTS